MPVPAHLQNEILQLLRYEPPGFGTFPPTGFSDSATRSHSPLCATSPILEISPADRIKIAYSDSTPKRLALLVALVPVEPIFQKIRYECDLSNEVCGRQPPIPPHVNESKPLLTLQWLDQPSGRRRGEKSHRSFAAARSKRRDTPHGRRGQRTASCGNPGNGTPPPTTTAGACRRGCSPQGTEDAIAGVSNSSVERRYPVVEIPNEIPTDNHDARIGLLSRPTRAANPF